MKRSLTLVLSLFALCLPGCGTTAENPVEPGATTPSVVTSTMTFTSTVTGNPVAGASVVVAGTAYTTGADGTIALSTPALVGATIDASAAGFLDRVTAFRTSALTLWEIPAGADVNFVRQLAYNRGGTAEVLWRPTAAALFLQLTGELASDPAVRAAHVQAAAMATAMTGKRVTVQVGGAASASVSFTALLNPSSPGSTTTYVTQSRGAIQGGRVEYATVDAARSTRVIAHEMGHMLGFGHAPFGLMCPSSCGVDNFGPQEEAVFVSMWQRAPGTAALDNDRLLLTGSSESTAVFSCDIR